MKTLPTQFTESGWNFTQIDRDGDIAIYRKHRIGGHAISFETIIIQRHEGFKVPAKDGGKKDVPPAEFYPSSAQWGSLGWSFTALASAERKRDILLMAEQSA